MPSNYCTLCSIRYGVICAHGTIHVRISSHIQSNYDIIIPAVSFENPIIPFNARDSGLSQRTPANLIMEVVSKENGFRLS